MENEATGEKLVENEATGEKLVQGNFQVSRAQLRWLREQSHQRTLDDPDGRKVSQSDIVRAALAAAGAPPA